MKENIPNLVGFKISRPVLNSILSFGTFLGSFDQFSVRKIRPILSNMISGHFSQNSSGRSGELLGRYGKNLENNKK